jgi:prepilin-type N-terminal cleavage/methylation domain-containing protein
MQRGFSLVELSIVLVILGLLTGGILAGQSLIRASELRAVTTEYQRYITAVGSFRDKYFALPGDFNNAVAFWGASAACPSISSTAAAGVCNGDGSGAIAAAATNSNELFGFWEHLAYAGLIEGTFTGSPNSTTATHEYALPGTNVPRSKISNAGWSAVYLGPVTVTSTTYYEANYGNVFEFGGSQSTALTNAANLKAEEAWNIDTKMDDGKPATGSIVTWESQGSVAGSTGCGNLAASISASLAASEYRLDTTSANCSFIFKTGY